MYKFTCPHCGSEKGLEEATDWGVEITEIDLSGDSPEYGISYYEDEDDNEPYIRCSECKEPFCDDDGEQIFGLDGLKEYFKEHQEA